MLHSLSHVHDATSVVGSTTEGGLELEAGCEADFVWIGAVSLF